MQSKRRLLAILAHPDDESLGFGGTFAKYAAEGAETFLITATRGQRGRYGRAEQSPGWDVVGQAREAELRDASRVLGIRQLHILDYLDGDLDQAPPRKIVHELSHLIREIRPQVVMTFGPDGVYGHPDHIAISHFTGAALIEAAHAGEGSSPLPPHAVSKLYWFAWSHDKFDFYQSVFKKLTSKVDGCERQALATPDWMINARLDTGKYWPTCWEAIRCHQTQIAIYESLDALSEKDQVRLWGTQYFCRVFSLVNGGRQPESDLFTGIF